MVATLKKIRTHEIVSLALSALRNLEHRGASGAEPDSGDGAGILIQIPDKFYRSVIHLNYQSRVIMQLAFSLLKTGVKSLRIK